MAIWEGVKKSWETAFGKVLEVTLFFMAIVLPCLLRYSRTHGTFDIKDWEEGMNYWVSEIPLYGLGIWLLGHIFWQPYKRYREQFETHRVEIADKETEIQTLCGQIQTLTELKPFMVEAIAEGYTCYIRITNLNHSQCEARIKFKNIEPPFRGPPIQDNNTLPWPHGGSSYESAPIDLTGAVFSFKDNPDGYLASGEAAIIPLFIVHKGQKGIGVYFDGKWKPGSRNQFIGEGEHTIIFDVLSSGMPSSEHKLKVIFSDIGWQVDIS